MRADTMVTTPPRARSRQSGQTLVVAVILLGVLVSLGFAFAAVLSGNIRSADTSSKRTLAGDLARAGAEYAHYQLRFSALGADWRPTPTALDVDAQGFTRDPDAAYLRPADPLAFPDRGGNPVPGLVDLGGPDGLGPYSRVFFERGRALVRVRYAPSEFDSFANPTGNLRRPGQARGYLSVEVVGRPGALRTDRREDPTLRLGQRVQVAGYASLADKTRELGRIKQADAQLTDSRSLLAFASIGIVETARFVTNKDRVSRPAEIGFPAASASTGARNPFDEVGLGVTYGDVAGQVQPVAGTLLWGQAFPDGTPGAPNWERTPGGGSLHSNADLKVFGQNDIVLNAFVNEGWSVAGSIAPGNSGARLRVIRSVYRPANSTWGSAWSDSVGSNASTFQNPLVVAGDPPANGYPLDSGAARFTTLGGVLRDGRQDADVDGFSRGAARKEPPSIIETDPQNGLNRYLVLTRDSGALVNGRNSGRFGYGSGVYVDSPERGNSNSEDERQIAGAVRSLPTDWLNPNNAQTEGWRGPFYIPRAPTVRLLPDGFEIVRDTRSRVPFWRRPDGGPTTETRARFRVRSVGYPTAADARRPMVIDSITQPALVGRPGASLTDQDFRLAGRLFNGVLLFEGDVRVRGVIPTDQQITLASFGTVYVDGSVTKGVVDETGTVLQRPSRSMAMLMARDYVTLNTTLFFGPAPGERVDEKDANAAPDTANPFELRIDNPDIVLETAFLLDPLSGNPLNPSSWQPYARTYTEAGGGGSIPTRLLLTSAADDNGPGFVSVDALSGRYLGGGDWATLLVPRTIDFGATQVVFNAASPFFPNGTTVPVYGLGNPALNAFPKFENVGLPLVDASFTFNGRNLVSNNPDIGPIALGVQDPTFLRVRMNAVGQVPMKNYLASRVAVAPHDVRIEASLFAEDGSFFVIPGHWTNLKSDDTRQAWLDRTTAGSPYRGLNDDEARQRRFELYGHSPEVPFYGEPLAVRVSLFGAVSENMPAPISAQAEWLKKWGWMPRLIGASGRRIPAQHTSGLDLSANPTVPNLTLVYDPVLASSSADGRTPLRTDEFGRALPPMPRLPVSPTLAYFGEVNP